MTVHGDVLLVLDIYAFSRFRRAENFENTALVALVSFIAEYGTLVGSHARERRAQAGDAS